MASIQDHNLGGSSFVTLQMEDGIAIKTKILIGCDGMNSMMAHWLGLGQPLSSGRLVVCGLAVYPQGHGLKQEFQQFFEVGTKGRFCPLNDKELYWFLVSS